MEQRISVKNDLVNLLWLDPKRDYLVLRQSLTKAGKAIQQIDIQYKPHESLEWVLHSWSTKTRIGNSQMLISENVTVTNFRINSQEPDSKFYVRFPSNTRISDEIRRTDSKYTTSGIGVSRQSVPYIIVIFAIFVALVGFASYCHFKRIRNSVG